MLNITYPSSWGKKEQSQLLTWVRSETRNPNYSGFFIVTLKDGSNTIEKYDSNSKQWTNQSVMAWAGPIKPYKP